MALPEMPDVSLLLDEVQAEVDTIDIPKPPSTQEAGQFFLNVINAISEKLGFPAPFPAPMPPDTALPSPPPGLPAVPQVPKTSSPFRLPF